MQVNNLKTYVMANVIHLVNVHDQLLAYIFSTMNFNFIINSLPIKKHFKLSIWQKKKIN